MEGLAHPKHNNGRIEKDVAPRGLVWMKEQGPLSSWGIWRGGKLAGRATNDHHNTSNTTSLLYPWAACHPAASPSHAPLKGNVSQLERQAIYAASTSVRTSSCQSQVTEAVKDPNRLAVKIEALHQTRGCMPAGSLCGHP
ncbi:unnamed protein product [Pleuronectes platessa]|uniref:Uncharacterized protein n=1 Tax=Pleuronectes platessa TaxID=8262 RepID=A0A9N7YMU5_PLEPL|nr:unnamed protein product [Pleuronectes platessa]